MADVVAPVLKSAWFAVLWPVATSAVAFTAGKAYERWKEDAAKQASRKTGARLVTRVLVMSGQLIDGLLSQITTELDPQTPKQLRLASAHVTYVMEHVSELEDLRPRTVEFEDEKLEAALYRWQAEVINALKRLDLWLSIDADQFMRLYGIGPRAIYDNELLRAQNDLTEHQEWLDGCTRRTRLHVQSQCVGRRPALARVARIGNPARS